MGLAYLYEYVFEIEMIQCIQVRDRTSTIIYSTSFCVCVRLGINIMYIDELNEEIVFCLEDQRRIDK